MLLVVLSPAWAGATTTTTSEGSEAALARIMLTQPLPGYSHGGDYGPLTESTYARYAPSPAQARTVFRHDAGEPGFAGVIRTWQDRSGRNQVRELALHFHSIAEARGTDTAYQHVLTGTRTGSGGSNSFTVDGIASARGYLISATAPGSSRVTDQLQVVLMRVRDYLVLLETDVQPGSANPHPIPSGTAATLAERQYPAIPGALALPTPSPQAANHSLSTTWLAVAAVVGVVAVAGAFALGVNRVGRAHRPGGPRHPG